MGESFLRERPIAILPGQYFDAETGLHQNWHRDYDPSIGRYLQVDPLLSPNNLLTDETAFFVPALIRTPEWLHPYNYVVNNPLTETDKWGLGLLNFIKCLYYSSKVAEAAKKCDDRCPNDMEGQIKYIEQYTTDGSLETARLNCTCKEAGKDLCAKWLANCITTPVGMGPKP